MKYSEIEQAYNTTGKPKMTAMEQIASNAHTAMLVHCKEFEQNWNSMSTDCKDIVFTVMCAGIQAALADFGVNLE